MAQALKIHTTISGKTLTLSDLGAFEGKRVEVTIAEEDEPAQSNSQRPIRRELGQLRGKIWIADDFDGPLPEDIQRYFEGAGD
jgi:hypothetical protein